MEWLLMLMLRNLPTARWLGWAVFSIAGAAIVLGLRLGRLFRRVTRAFGRAGVESDLTLATAYPNWPTWWIPETGIGFLAWVVVGALGAWLAFTAKTLQKRIG